MININNLELITNSSQLSIDVETNAGYFISSILLWKMDDFKDYSLAKNLNYKLEQVNNKEIFIVSAQEAGVSIFEDIYFIEIEGTITVNGAGTFIPRFAQKVSDGTSSVLVGSSMIIQQIT